MSLKKHAVKRGRSKTRYSTTPGWTSAVHVIDPSLLTERGLSAVASAREGGELFIHRFGRWLRVGPNEIAHAEKLALHHPQALVQYGATPPPRRRRRGKSISKRKVRSR